MHHAALREDASSFPPSRRSLDAQQAETPTSQQHPIDVIWCNDPRQTSADDQPCPSLGIAGALARARTAAERNRMINGLLHLVGFSTFAYFALESNVKQAERLFLHEAFVPPTYRGDYVKQGYHEIDPRTLAARRANAPMVWDLYHLREQSIGSSIGTPEDRAVDGFLSTMRDDGMCSGLMFAMPIPGTRLSAFMSFTAPRRSRDWITSATVEQSLSIALSVHAFALPQLTAASRSCATNSLTPFERELLMGIAEGASDKEIGRRLDTSAHNVDYHLRKLRKRFGVANRIELTYLTSKLELI